MTSALSLTLFAPPVNLNVMLISKCAVGVVARLQKLTFANHVSHIARPKKRLFHNSHRRETPTQEMHPKSGHRASVKIGSTILAASPMLHWALQRLLGRIWCLCAVSPLVPAYKKLRLLRKMFFCHFRQTFQIELAGAK